MAHRRMVRFSFSSAPFLFGVLSFAGSEALAAPVPQPYVNGTANDECVFPTAVYIGGCTATLVHPRAITTAQHCSPGAGTSVTFGEERAPTRGRVTVTRCVTGSSDDGAICELDTAVDDIPVTPIAFGCEIDKYMQVNEPVWYSGYGNISPTGTPTTEKLWAESYIAEVHDDYTVIGAVRGDDPNIPSPCNGDSGGPVFLRTADGSYRNFGTVFRGTTRDAGGNPIPCNGAANFQRVDTIVSAFESETGLDITPCFDGATGDWDPTADCGGFYADEPGTSMGTWDSMCSNATVSGESAECGDTFSGAPPAGTGGASGSGGSGSGGSGSGTGGSGSGSGGDSGSGTGGNSAPGVGGTSNAAGAPGQGPGGDNDAAGDDGGCGCRLDRGPIGGRSGLLGAASLLLLAGLARRRRSTESL